MRAQPKRYAEDFWSDRKAIFLEQCRYEWAALKQTWPYIAFGVFWQYFHSVATNLVYYLHQPRPTLRDLGFELFSPPVTGGGKVVSEVFFFLPMLFLMLFGVSMFLVRRERRVLFVTVLTRVMVVLVACQFLRIITFLVTVLPSPNEHCRPGSPKYDPPTSAKEIFFRMDAFTGCGDLVFSSHTIFCLTFTLAAWRYMRSLAFKVFMWMLAVTLGGLVVATRKHYSIDVVIAFYTVPMVWVMAGIHFKDYVPVLRASDAHFQPLSSSDVESASSGRSVDGGDELEMGLEMEALKSQ